MIRLILILKLALALSLPMLTSATLYSVSPDYKISLQETHSQLAHAYYREQGFSTGWNYLHIYANAEVSLIDLHRGAGYLEGYTTFRQIYFAWKNIMKAIIKGPRLSQEIEQFVNDQLDYIDDLTENHGN